MTLALIDYGSGNLRSAAKALERAARERGLSLPVSVTDDPEVVAGAERVVLPGVGAFAECMRGLAAISGMTQAIERAAIERGRPLLGICVGMQLMAEEGHEHETTRGFGWIPGAVEPLRPADPGLKIPHMGWNAITLDREDHPVLAGLGGRPYLYFVHSYHLVPRDPADRLAWADYGGPVTAAVGRDTIVGTQFHPEKSQAAGLRLLGNFLEWRP